MTKLGSKLGVIGNSVSELNNSEMIKVLTVDPIALVENEKNFYQTDFIEDLIESFISSGQLEPIVVEKRVNPLDGDKFQYVVISGHRRRKALIQYNERVDSGIIDGEKLQARIIVKDFSDPLESELQLLDYNSQRIKSKEERDKEIVTRHKLYTGLKRTQPEKFGNRSFHVVDQISMDMNVSPATVKRVINQEKDPETSTNAKKQVSNDNKIKKFNHEFVMKCYANNAKLRKELIYYILNNDDKFKLMIEQDYIMKAIYLDNDGTMRTNKKDTVEGIERQMITLYFNSL